MRVFARFSTQPFFGELSPIHSVEDLFKQVKNRVGLLNLLEDEQGNPRSSESFSEQELLDIYKNLSRHDEIHLVSSIEELKKLSDDDKFQKLVEQFIDHHKAS
ncbi:hypothetical protein [Vibrio parahaemolyticus]|uniref:hypothetical protein n=1 Tax=Vibrio parahaemolyticus TaxID=670 RepID=UPI0015D44C57|nr:hypothetical protein [Vibrio parahaemolyticus]NYU23779.1 hypothetical protein [Vibrio parahaemolyticus]